MAYVLMAALRRIGLKGTALANATCGSVRLKLLKIGALVRLSAAHVAGHEGERARQQGTPAQTPTGPLGHGPDGEPTPQWPSVEAYAEAAGRLSGAPLARNDAERSGVQK